jgi:hypothetical protein
VGGGWLSVYVEEESVKEVRRAAGLFFSFLAGLCPDFFEGWILGFFTEKWLLARGVLWIADGKMCGKGLRDALFRAETGSIWMLGGVVGVERM